MAKMKTTEYLNDEILYDDFDETIETEIEEEVSAKLNTEDANKDAVIIMENYRNGKMLKESAENALKDFYKLKEKEKLTVSMLMGPTPKGIDPEEYKNLVKTYNDGVSIMNRSKEEMINKLDMFIYYIIERQFTTFKKYTKDLYQEGVVGILKGIDTYNPEKSKPTTFFFIYIVHEMTEFINMNINKTTSHYSANIVKVKKAINQFEREGRDWTIKDIAQETKISAETITQALNIMESANEMHYETADYLDSQISQRNPSPEEEYLKNETSALIMQAISNLPKDEANVILLKYGLSGEEPMSYKNISIRLGIQIDKVKKLNSAGIRKLRRSKIISGNFKALKKEEKALNDTLIGIVPIETAQSIMDELDRAFAEEEAMD